jgi:UDP-N-acetylmuramoyl-tripeptide--D-alanyl-D-alanine ligase
MEKLYKLFYETSGICSDSRKITKDCLFICLKGENFNGNVFAQSAIENGAKYVISDVQNYCNQKTIFYVDNALIFLQKLANYHRNQFSIPVIGITGSNGKTTSKELISCVLAKKYNVLFTEGNLNNHIGVPLTLLRLKAEHEIAVIEMGANKFFDIQELTEIAEPTLGIITNIGKAHLEGFKNFEGVLKTKKELYDSIENTKGKIIINNDDSILKSILPSDIKCITYGENSNSDIEGELVKMTPFVEFKWKSNDYNSPIIPTNLIGKYNFYNFLAAITFGVQFDIDPQLINEALETYNPTNNRSQVKETAKNKLILDCYNANPTSMKSALESFAQIPTKEKTFIIGDMLELGDESIKEHENIIELIDKLNLKGFYVGSIFKTILNENNNAFDTRENAEVYFNANQFIGQLILLKGSRGIGLEKLEILF